MPISEITALTAFLHQSLMTTSSKRNARTGSLDTAFSSKQTSVTSAPNVKETTEKKRCYIPEKQKPISEKDTLTSQGRQIVQESNIKQGMQPLNIHVNRIAVAFLFLKPFIMLLRYEASFQALVVEA
jgi:hypothetical protein